MHTTNHEPERALLTGVAQKSPVCLDELAKLVETLGAVEVGRLTQILPNPHPARYFGKGKVQEIADAAAELNADVVITDDELSPGQLKNLQNELNVKVIDRTQVILDIFSQNAQTAEAKLQVLIARLGYRLSHITGLGIWLSRQGAQARGMGTASRGPGETQLEMNRRTIRNRIADTKKELEVIKKRRGVARAKRSQNASSVALVGYTNAGKSSLLNALTGADVLSEDRLFATLSTTTRKSHNTKALITDTVGFIMKLPHQLVSSFRATLEEACFADVLVHVTDASHPRLFEQMDVVYETLQALGVRDKPIITVHNKIDITENLPPADTRAAKTLHISAKTGMGLGELIDAINELT